MKNVDKDTVRTLVREAFENHINGLIEEQEEKKEEEKKTTDNDDNDDDDDDDDDETLSEALNIEVTDSSNKMKNMKVNSMRDIVKMAKTGQYHYFVVKKASGEEIEFSVENGKLVEM